MGGKKIAQIMYMVSIYIDAQQTFDFKWISGRKIPAIEAITPIAPSLFLFQTVMLAFTKCRSEQNYWWVVLNVRLCCVSLAVDFNVLDRTSEVLCDYFSQSTFRQLPPLQERAIQSARLQTKKAISCSSYSQIYFRIQSILIADSKLHSPEKHMQKTHSPAMDCSSENYSFRKPQSCIF